MLKNIIKKINLYKEKKYLKNLRKKNKNTNPTIVSNNCIGGVIYHNLGLQFQSPTINLFFKVEDYLEFVKNFKYYSKCELEEFQGDNINYPVGILKSKDEFHKDLTIFFQHYSSFEEAKQKWIERYLRVNWDNIYFILEFYDTIYNHDLMYEFDKLNLKNKIIITHRNFDNLNNSITVSCYNDDKPTAKILKYKGISGKRYLEEFNYVNFLNKNIKGK